MQNYKELCRYSDYKVLQIIDIIDWKWFKNFLLAITIFVSKNINQLCEIKLILQAACSVGMKRDKEKKQQGAFNYSSG